MTDLAQGDLTPQDPPAAAAAPATGPWANEIAAVFTDPAIASSVSQFMAEKYQPYVTRIEQEKAQLADKAGLFEQFEADAGATFLEVAEELFGEDGKTAVMKALQSTYETPPETPPATEPAATEEPPNEDLQWVKNFREQTEAEQAKTEYNTAVDAIAAANPGFDKNLFHPFVVAAGGDLDGALEAYSTWAEAAGIVEKVPAPDVPVPPATITSQGTPPGPTLSKAASLSDAVDEFFADNAAPAPPTV